jgi:hypothetical protein
MFKQRRSFDSYAWSLFDKAIDFLQRDNFYLC